MAFGIGAPGSSPEAHAGEVRCSTLAEYREQIRADRAAGHGRHHAHVGQHQRCADDPERLFDNSHVTPAVRANDTSDIFIVRGCVYRERAGPAVPLGDARPHPMRPRRLRARRAARSARTWACTASRSTTSWTTTSRTLERFHAVPRGGRAQGIPPLPRSLRPEHARALSTRHVLPHFINDMIARTLAGVGAGRAAAVPQDRLSRPEGDGGAGPLRSAPGRRHPRRVGAARRYDAFKLLAEAQKYGASVALYGRKINNAENQLAFVEFLRLIVDGVIAPEEAVKAYHAVLGKLGIRPHRSLEDDLRSKRRR